MRKERPMKYATVGFAGLATLVALIFIFAAPELAMVGLWVVLVLNLAITLGWLLFELSAFRLRVEKEY